MGGGVYVRMCLAADAKQQPKPSSDRSQSLGYDKNREKETEYSEG